MTVRLADRELQTKFGLFNEILFSDGQSESVALVLGDVGFGEDVLCRIHSACLGGHVFNSVECTCAAEMAAAQMAICGAGRGVIIYLEQEGKGNGHLALMKSIPFKKAGFSQGEAYEKAGYPADARSYEPAAAILNELQVRSIILLTDNPSKATEIERLGISVASTQDISAKLSQNT